MQNVPKNVLLVDDDPIMMEQYLLELSINGFNTVYAKTFHEAHDYLKSNQAIDFIVQDIMMPFEEGLPKLKDYPVHLFGISFYNNYIRELHPNTPVLFLTNFIGMSQITEFLNIDKSCKVLFKIDTLPKDLVKIIDKSSIELGVVIPERYEYDVAFSFAGNDRAYVAKVALYLKDMGVKVFYDDFEREKIWGKDLSQHLAEIYNSKAKYCVIFISKYYKGKVWCKYEQQHAQARALEESYEYILPVRFDETEIIGMPKTISYIDISDKPPEKLGQMIIKKLRIYS